MSDLRCALVDATGTVSNVIVCCGNDPASCSLKPTRITAAMGTVGPGYMTDGKGGFTPPPAPVITIASATVSSGNQTVASATVTK